MAIRKMSKASSGLRCGVALLMLAALPGAASPAPSVARDQPAGSIAALLRPVEGRPVINGGVLVAEDDRLILRAAYGLADFARRTPSAPDSLFQVASAAKPFTATAILQLRDRKRLDLDDPVRRYLPGFPYPDIRIRHLLSHTSGLPDLELFEAMVAADPGKVVGGGDLVPALIAWGKPLAFRPGDRFLYSNVNYQLLARIVEIVGGQAFPAYMRDHVFRPAGMRSTYVLGGRALEPQRPPVANQVHAVLFRDDPEDVRSLRLDDPRAMRPYRYEGYNLGSTVGDQNLFTTLDDMRRFDRALREGRVLSRRSQAEAFAPTRLNDGSVYRDAEVYQIYQARCSYGLGWEVCDHPVFGRIVGHAGYNRGIETLFYRNLDKDQLIVLYDNGDSGSFAIKAASLANLLEGAPALPFPRARSLTRAYGAELVRNGGVAALLMFNAHRADPSSWSFTRDGLNRLGYDLLRNGHPDLAIEAFRLNLILNPNDSALCDSLGDGLAKLGRRADAIAAYGRAVELDPKASESAAKLRRLAAGG